MYPGFKPAHDAQLRSFAIVNRGLVHRLKIVRYLIVNTHRQPNLRRQNLHRADETLRRDSDDRERTAVDEQLRAEHAWIEIVFLPVTVTDDHDRRVAAAHFLFRSKLAASRQR